MPRPALPRTPRDIILLFLHLAFGGAFVYAAVVKLWNLGPIHFTDDIRSFHLLGDPWVAWVAMSLPWMELLAGLAVVFGIGRRGGLMLLIGSLVVFLIAIIQAMARGIDIRCGCFGHTEEASAPWELIARDVILLAVGIYLLWPRKTLPSSGG